MTLQILAAVVVAVNICLTTHVFYLAYRLHAGGEIKKILEGTGLYEGVEQVLYIMIATGAVLIFSICHKLYLLWLVS